MPNMKHTLRVPIAVYSLPKRFEPFEIDDIKDDRLFAALRETKEPQQGDLVYIQVRRLVAVDPKTEIHEFLISALFRWEGARWFMIAPGVS